MYVPVTLVEVRFMWFLGRGGVKRYLLVDNGDIFFSVFGVYIFRGFRIMASVIVQCYLVPHLLTQIPTSQMTLNDLEEPFYVCADGHFAHFADE